MESKWTRHKIENFRGAKDFFGPLNGTRRQPSAILGPKKPTYKVRVNFLGYGTVLVYKDR